MLIPLPICHEFEDNYKSTFFFLEKLMAAPVKPYSPRMFASTNYVYASEKHLAKKSMCVDPDIIFFYNGINAVYMY